jgi:hypothetical protein
MHYYPQDRMLEPSSKVPVVGFALSAVLQCTSLGHSTASSSSLAFSQILAVAEATRSTCVCLLHGVTGCGMAGRMHPTFRLGQTASIGTGTRSTSLTLAWSADTFRPSTPLPYVWWLILTLRLQAARCADDRAGWLGKEVMSQGAKSSTHQRRIGKGHAENTVIRCYISTYRAHSI